MHDIVLLFTSCTLMSLIDNMFVVCCNEIYQQTVRIPISTKSTPLLAELLVYSREAEFIEKFLHAKK
jgi:hypothetical protein